MHLHVSVHFWPLHAKSSTLCGLVIKLMTFSEDEDTKVSREPRNVEVGSSCYAPCTPQRRAPAQRTAPRARRAYITIFYTRRCTSCLSLCRTADADVGMDRLERKKGIHHSGHRPTSDDHDEADGEGEHRHAIHTSKAAKTNTSTCSVRLKALKINPPKMQREDTEVSLEPTCGMWCVQ